MKPPVKTSTSWKRIAETSSVDDAGILHVTYHVMDLGSGDDFTVSISGRGESLAGLFVGAMQVSAAFLARDAGIPIAENITTKSLATVH